MDLVAAYDRLLEEGANLPALEGMSPDEVVYLAEQLIANNKNPAGIVEGIFVQDQVLGIVQNFLEQYRNTVIARIQNQELAAETKHLPGKHNQDDHAGDYISSSPLYYAEVGALKSKEWGTSHLLSGDVTDTVPNPGRGIAASYFGKIGSHEVFVKPQSGAPSASMRGKLIETGRDSEREVAAFAVNKYLGDLVPMAPTVIRDIRGTGKSVVADALDGEPLSAIRGGVKSLKDPANFLSFTLFDGLIGNLDRHAGNVFVDNTGKAYAIDHGLAFPKKSGPGNNNELVATFGWNVFSNARAAQRLGINFHNQPLLSGHKDRLQKFVDDESGIRKTLGRLLNQSELDALFGRAKFMLKENAYIHEDNIIDAAS